MPRLRNILVANRGEIALRVMRTARSLGYGTVAIYSEADAHAAHVSFADHAVLVGPSQVGASYLNIERIVAAAVSSGADAVHPGYGLLSENAAFARACAQAGLTFIGPTPETIELMGNKRRARIAMRAAGVACVPGYDGEDQSDESLIREAQAIGFPVMVKAAAGGGGRGMRRVNEAVALPEAIARARSEAQNAFGDGRLILERAIDGARHVEVQVFADSHGRAIHLGERDCSVQRRFQKVIEEAPSPAVDTALRQRLGELAVRVAQSSGYVGAGTVELLLSPTREFYFLEMNTRLQVEHAVTELITGLDLVAWQLRIAEGEALPLMQSEVPLHGHAIEARLYAEEPERGFLPATGRVLSLTVPKGEGVRVDHGLQPGLVISSHYDPMLAKVIAHGPDRETARRRLLFALQTLRVLGVRTNQHFLQQVLEHERFVAGEATTDFLDRSFAMQPAARPSEGTLLAAALAFIARSRTTGAYPSETADFSNCVGLAWPLDLGCGAERLQLTVSPARGPGALHLRLPDGEASVTLLEASVDSIVFLNQGARLRFDHAWDGDELWVHSAEGTRVFRDLTYAPVQAQAGAAGTGRALAPMDGTVVAVPVQVGTTVSAGQTLAVIEAMKLELRVAADIAGIVAAVHVQRGDQVKARQVLIEVQAQAVQA